MKKILVLAFGNPDNVLTLCRHLSARVELTLVFVVSGDRFRQGVMDADLSFLKNGLNTDEGAIRKSAGEEVNSYIDGRFKLWFLKTPSRKFIHKRGGISNFRIIRQSARQLSEIDFDAVHFNGTSGFLLYLMRYIKCRKRVWTLHDYKPHTGEENRTGEFLNRLVIKSDIKYIQHYEYLREEFARYFKVKIDSVFQVYSGAFDVYESFKPAFTEVPARYILFFGRFSRYKGIDLLVRAFGKVRQTHKDVHLVLAGAGDTGFELREGENIKILNRHVSPNELVHLIRNCICVVTPYTDSTHSGVIMTSYTFNKPVIASDTGGIKEVVKDKETGLLFRNGSEEELTAKIVELCGNANKVKEMESNIAEIKREGILKWDAIAVKMISVYSSL